MVSLYSKRSASFKIASILAWAAGCFLIILLNVFGDQRSGVIVLAAIIGMFASLVVMIRYESSVYQILIISVFMFWIQRITHSEFPFGIAFDYLIVLSFLALLFNTRQEFEQRIFSHPVTLLFLFMMIYNFFEVLNPYGTMLAWGVSLRNNVYFLLFIVCYHMMGNIKQLTSFTSFWILIALVVALYGIYQQIFGLSQFEWEWVNSSPERYKIYYVWGSMRKFSFLSDPSAYGLFLAFSGLTSLILAIHASNWKQRTIFGAATIIIFIAMSFSGTRSAIAMVAAGAFFYTLLNLRSRKTLLATVVIASATLILLFGPFHGWQVNRIRSTFQLQEDPSMGVRDNKRLRYQAFVREHPIGVGIFTTAYNGSSFAPNHELAGFDPDSGYLETALETGWIGLIILLAFLFVAMKAGVDGYFSLKNGKLRVYLLAYLVPFFALSIAHFAQNALFAKPSNLLVFISLALIVRVSSINHKQVLT